MPEGLAGISRVRSLLAARRRGAVVEGAELESAGDSTLHADEVLARVDDVMRRVPEGDVADPREFRRALEIFLRQAGDSLRKVEADPGAPLDGNDAMALEAVIRADGTRPSLLVRGGAVDPNHPLAGDWRETLNTLPDAFRLRIAAVGRIEPAGATASNYFGTGWVVDSGKGLVLTNLHVLEAMWRRLPHAMLRTDTGFRILPGAAFIDFLSEAGSVASKRFPIVEARPSGVDGSGYARLDAAVLKLGDGDAGETLPDAIPVIADQNAAQGGMLSFCTVGYPGRPPYLAGTHEGVDWVWVNTTLFGGRYGVKRLAPGAVHRPLGSFANDPQIWILGHDATTLGGSSGSPILAWKSQGAGSFGLHFAGASIDTNCAHAVSECRDALERMGVPVKDPE